MIRSGGIKGRRTGMTGTCGFLDASTSASRDDLVGVVSTPVAAVVALMALPGSGGVHAMVAPEALLLVPVALCSCTVQVPVSVSVTAHAPVPELDSNKPELDSNKPGLDSNNI